MKVMFESAAYLEKRGLSRQDLERARAEKAVAEAEARPIAQCNIAARGMSLSSAFRHNCRRLRAVGIVSATPVGVPSLLSLGRRFQFLRRRNEGLAAFLSAPPSYRSQTIRSKIYPDILPGMSEL